MDVPLLNGWKSEETTGAIFACDKYHGHREAAISLLREKHDSILAKTCSKEVVPRSGDSLRRDPHGLVFCYC